MFFPLLALPSAQARRAKIRGIGYGVQSGFELNFGRYLPSFGRTNGDDTGTQWLSEQIPYYAVRHAVRPGITGWAQVRYKYGNTLEDAQGKSCSMTSSISRTHRSAWTC